MTLDRRSLLVSGGAAAGRGAGVGRGRPGSDRRRRSRRLEVRRPLFLKDDDGLAPATFDRLPLEWHQARAKALQAHLDENGFAGVWLSDPMNIIYFTGLFFTTTERPFSVFLPADKLATVWFHPGLDRDLVKSWWSTESEYYFDFQHADGAFPNEGKVQQGAKVDLFEWVLKGLKKRGYDGKRIATDKDLSPRQLAKAGSVFLKDTKFDSIDEHCEKLRMVKSPEELALWRRAYRVFDETHAFARDLLLAKGTDLTDYQLGDGGAGVRHGTAHVRDQARRQAAHRRRDHDGGRGALRRRHRVPASRTRCTTTRSRRARRSRSRAASRSAAAAESSTARSCSRRGRTTRRRSGPSRATAA